MANPWERQEGETDKSFAAFCVYRDQGPSRSLDQSWRLQTGRETGTAPGHFAAWSAEHNWAARVAAYDAHLDSLRLGAKEEGIVNDRKAYRERVKKEAEDFALAAVAMRREAMLMDDKVMASLVFSRASAVWEKARQVEGMALGLVGGERDG